MGAGHIDRTASLRQIVLRHPHLTSQDVTDLLAGTPTAQHLCRLRDQRSLLGLRIVRRGYMYPAFQFDTDRRRIVPDVVKVNQLLLSQVSPADALEWWLSTQDGRASPVDLLAAEGPAATYARAAERVRVAQDGRTRRLG